MHVVVLHNVEKSHLTNMSLYEVLEHKTKE